MGIGIIFVGWGGDWDISHGDGVRMHGDGVGRRTMSRGWGEDGDNIMGTGWDRVVSSSLCQSLQQIVKCHDNSCCGQHRSNYNEAFPQHFLPPPAPYRTITKGVVYAEVSDTDIYQ